MTGLRGLRLLVVEDEYIVAEELRFRLIEAGVAVLGPVPSVGSALDLLACNPIDGAILDVNLGSESAFALADVLQHRDIPFVFLSGYTRISLPARFARVTLLEKPMDVGSLAGALERARRAGRD